MCGFVGQLTYSDARDAGADHATLRRLVELAARRGPDDDGTWSDAHCRLGFRRLAIIDPSPAGHQPMRSGDGRYAIVYNGALCNFRELRGELESAGVGCRLSGEPEG